MPILLVFKKTAIIGYLINGMSVVIGSVVMVHFTLTVPPVISISGIFLYTTIPYILILFPKLLIGQSVLLYYYPRGRGRMFTPGWWTRHFLYVAIMYALGNIFWK